ncbi:branched-chain amino acid ABC transporter permease [Nocardioides anomalus]|uniref:Branched-chain amino acid ABC transporter permease n=1 Tax=Nocardioides anomalus TaxID=2712223 RepID=A0A6G6WBB1_9ACTN|nr:branched-chain amino acid ABC transporter permease [Nocardioides anomalus]QIG42631.1 branched-chain amino acid ABC transporter permease [Nocardioides anomalus]
MEDIQGILNAMMRVAVDPQTAAVAIAVIGLNIHFGYTGLLNIGQSAFMLLGAYGFAISITHDIPMFFAVIIGLLVAFVFALVLGVPTLKLRGDYLAIVTISAAEIVRYVGRSVGVEWLFNLTGGAQGIPGSQYRDPFTSLSPIKNGDTTLLPFNYHDVGGGSTLVRVIGWLLVIAVVWFMVRVARGKAGLTGGARTGALVGLSVLVLLLALFLAPVNARNTGVDGWWFTLVAWVLVAVATLLVLGLTRSPWGRALKGVREDEDAMRSLGKNVFAIKMQALVIGGLFGALGGMIYVLPATVQPDALGRNITFFAYTALLLGGAATIWGPVLGSLIFFSGRIGIIAIANTYLSSDKYLNVMNGQQTSQFAFIVVGVALMLLVIFRPQGILGDKRELRFNV